MWRSSSDSTTLAVKRFAVNSNQAGNTDLAVGELESDVSWSWANYIEVATSYPANNTDITAWGYGCTGGNLASDGGWDPNSLTYPPAGTKTYRAAKWDATNKRPSLAVTCPGDSGGPILDASGKIIAVNSRGPGTGSGSSNADIPALAVTYRSFIQTYNAIYGKRQVCDTCPTVSLLTWNGINWVKAINNGDGGVVADATAIGAWETFRFVVMGGGTGFLSTEYIALQTGSGRWIYADGGGGAGVTSGSNYVGPWETFKYIQTSPTATHALQAWNTSPQPRYVVAEGAGGGAVNANRTAIGDWEKFYFGFYNCGIASLYGGMCWNGGAWTFP